MSRKERLRVYHGIPKSIVDSNTVFYMSCDSLNPEINCLNSSKVGSSPTVYGTSCTGGSLKFIDLNYLLCTLNTSKVLTIDFILNMPSTTVSDTNILILSKSDTEYFSVRFGSDNTFHCDFTTPDLGTKYNWIPHVSTVFKLGINHIRVCFSDSDVLFYINGIYYPNKAVGSYPSVIKNDLLPNINALRLYFAYPTSDLHISNIDRGDYFPNLPQDFIDGGAIIKPKMGQQQIKGDPLYSQETVNIVKIGTNVNEPQITCSRTTGNWANGDTIKVKGLSDELITGVIDSDTALCKAISNTTTTIVLDSVSSLAIGDTFRLYNPIDKTIGADRTISNINRETNTITFSGNPLGSIDSVVGWILIESTNASSSPIVKTSDNNVVTGTWSSLGTNEATFTLGTNATLTTQDLYITYSLNIAPGNSDFTQLPYSIEKVYDGLGNQLEKVNEIIIEDDFKGKVSNSFVECPHYASFVASTTLQKPEQFTKDNSITYTNFYYNDSKTTNLINRSTNGNISQLLLSFDLIGIIEKKFNSTIVGNKASWLKSNIKSVTVDSTVCGSGASGNKINCTVYFSSTKSWNPASWSHSNATPKLLNCVVNRDTDIQKIIGDDGRVNYLFYTNATDTVTSSAIYLDYVCITIKLVDNTSFTTFFSKNKKARENPCNPILIQPETKTVKRYLPSKECFSTEVLYSDANSETGTISDNNIIYSYPYMYISTQGTGSYNTTTNDYFRECLAKLGFTKYSPCEFTNDIITNYKTTIGVDSPIRFETIQCDSYHAVNRNNIPKNFDFKGNFVALKPTLLLIDGEIILNVYARIFKNGVSNDLVEQKNYKISNRPLMK